VLPDGVGKNQSKAQGVVRSILKINKFFYSFSHIELQESGIENQEPFSHQTRMFVLF